MPELYPVIKPRKEQHLAVGDDHVLYVAEYGNPEGIPVIVVHGGPGAGCSPDYARYFDPKKYRIIMYDQRGAGMSKPKIAYMRIPPIIVSKT